MSPWLWVVVAGFVIVLIFGVIKAEGRRTGVLLSALIVALAGAVAFLAWNVEAPLPCNDAALAMVGLNASSPPAPQTGEPVSKTLKVRDDTQTRIALGSDPGPARGEITLEIDPQAAMPANRQVAVMVDSFRRGSDPDVAQAVNAKAAFTSPSRVSVALCVQRSGSVDGLPYRVDPGQYTASVTVIDGRLPVTTIPVTVTLSYANPWLVFLLWVWLVPVGAAYLLVIRRADAEHDPANLGITGLLHYLSSPIGMVSTIAGAAAALAVYIASYVNSPTWGSSAADWTNLVAAMFGAFVASATTFRFAKSLDVGRPPGSLGQEQEQPEGQPRGAARDDP